MAPIDEATTLLLRHRPERAWSHLDEAGFAVVADGDLVLVVTPAVRGRGHGARLLALALDSGHPVRTAWSHADHPAARRLAAGHGFEAVRSLWVMRRPLTDLPPLAPPPGVRLRTWADGDPGADGPELLRVNGAAFAHHPEQAAMDAANLAERMAEPWFEPTGLILAEADGVPGLAGFHWTKRHDADHGEVYVVGVAPEAQGRGLGQVLTLAGLHHLAAAGAREVLLYVESDNDPAVRLYRRLGFDHAPRDTHVQYARR